MTDSSLFLSGLTTLRLGGPAHDIVRCADTATLVQTLGALDDAGTPVLLVGGGSNLVIGDDGFPGTAVVIESSGRTFGDDAGSPFVTADAGLEWDALVAATIDAGFGGLECLSGIPGSTGATPVQNVGAYGVEVADILRAVEVYDRTTRTTVTLSPDDLQLGYRSSILKYRNEKVVVSVSFWLTPGRISRPLRYRELSAAVGVDPGESADSAEVRRTVLGLRAGKGMVLNPDDHDTWSAGSFFTNPIVDAGRAPEILERIAARVGSDVQVPTYPAGDGAVKFSAGWLIERAGFTKGYPGDHAPARLSTKHTLALTNRGQASTENLLRLAREVRAGVLAAFGVDLHPEPVLVGCEI
ncbi:UDP-N-acetylmuramate dehydrogenase [Gordonia amarae]|uniref:UDP-N-acetylenolpyruvoylglucosamine reductase n=2 Tax=Gordonia amarae TaxID=36821 RepID=G7GN84_9ACTN|nr:UDP-N-acetylmuramate dehydrogenase [Gordonia amarae]MCS3877158.1 UDP-N-acetylmuramate dehydrogenase [Gordonia amarae]QHN15946.1 UDP-N-acetylmuramate dehydrogenase [Gordonia amarae]QHN20514.1 UDP-N-acetylmuramate dehydrogenase [Gordonia amarae]QHN29366.1 UDP-N-acetylmuramate dehydrogenase [Gordonia amarae]QHN38145.1 UDP-N-acetylmuramate dehydrogenase [Gordonia amarae]